MTLLLELLALAGGIFVLIGAIGLLRLPDFYTRLHAAGVVDTLGMALVLIGLSGHVQSWLGLLKLGIIGLFILFTSPVSTHALARAALHGGLRPQAADADAVELHSP